jgi:glycosyltransferase involved in cell wall biosynthesis
MRILHLDDARSWRGGEQQVLYLHRGLLERGVDSVVVCPPHSTFADRLREEALPSWPWPQWGALDLLSAWRLGREARRRPALVHTHTSHAHSTALLAARLSGGFPLVVSRRVDFPIDTHRAKRRKYLDRRVGLYLAISSGVERCLLDGGVEPQRIRRVPSGIDLGRFEEVPVDHAWRESLSLPAGRILMGSVAALAPHKDQSTLLRAFARMLRMGIDAQLVILGEGGQRRQLESMRQELGLEDRVLMPGFTREILPRMRAFDLFVLSSHLEGLGTAILDAMALGLAVVATRTGGIPDAVVDGVTGQLVPPRDVEGMAHAMAAMARDPGARQGMGEAGRQRVREHFDVRRTVDLTVAAYEALLGHRLAGDETSPRY